jgi:hypothetical protein
MGSPLFEDDGPLTYVYELVRDQRLDAERGYEKSAYSVTTGMVRAQCNNGWMSRLEDRGKPFLEPMVHGRRRMLRQGEQRTLAAWALKTAIMAVIPPAEYAHLYEYGVPSDRVRMWMTSVTGGRMVAMGR